MSYHSYNTIYGKQIIEKIRAGYILNIQFNDMDNNNIGNLREEHGVICLTDLLNNVDIELIINGGIIASKL